MVAGPVSSGMVNGTTAIEVLVWASLTSPGVTLASAGWALSMASAEVMSNKPPPT